MFDFYAGLEFVCGDAGAVSSDRRFPSKGL